MNFSSYVTKITFINCTWYVSINFLPLKLLIPSLLASKMSGERKAVIKNADMAEDMQQDAVECATQVICIVLLWGGSVTMSRSPFYVPFIG